MDDIIIQKNLVYGEAKGEYLTADIYKPSNGHHAELPILILIHGGGFQSGSKEMYIEWGRKLAHEGYFVMAINYRLANALYAAYPGAIEDIKTALNWLVLKANKWELDIEKIGLIGDSAGAYFASQVALKCKAYSYKICSVIGIYGIYDFIDACKHPVNERSDNIYEKFLGMSFKGNESAFYEASPTSHVNDAVAHPTFDTRFFLAWGEEDQVVKPNQSEVFIEKLKSANIEAEFIVFKDKGHFWFNQLPGIEGGRPDDYPNNILYPRMIEFLKKSVIEAERGKFSRGQIKKICEIGHLKMEVKSDGDDRQNTY